MIAHLNLHFSWRVNRAMIKVLQTKLFEQNKFPSIFLLFPSFDSPCQWERGGGPKQTEVTPRLWPITTKKCTASFRIPFSLFFYGCEVLSRWHWSLAAGDIVFLKIRGINTYHNYTRRNLRLFRNNRALYGGIALLKTRLKNVDNKYRSK